MSPMNEFWMGWRRAIHAALFLFDRRDERTITPLRIGQPEDKENLSAAA